MAGELDPAAVEADVMAVVLDRLAQVGEAVRNRAVAILSEPGDPRAGAPPHSRTGELADSIVAEVDAAAPSVEIGSKLFKARVLELGTRTRPAHPFMSRALTESMPEIRRIFGA